jgi:hypothetical protein
MAIPEDDDEGMKELIRELEPYTEKALKSNYGLLHIKGDRYAVIERIHCSYTNHRGRRLAVPRFNFIEGYEDVEYTRAIYHVLGLRAKEDAE